MKKRILSIVLAAMMIVTLLPVTVWATSEPILAIGGAVFYAEDFTSGSEVYYGKGDASTHIPTRLDSSDGAEWMVSVTMESNQITAFHLTFLANSTLVYQSKGVPGLYNLIENNTDAALNITISDEAEVYLFSETDGIEVNSGIYSQGDVNIALGKNSELWIGDIVTDNLMEDSTKYLVCNGIDGKNVTVQGAEGSSLTIYDRACGIACDEGTVSLTGPLTLNVYDFGAMPRCCIRTDKLSMQNVTAKLVSQVSSGISAEGGATFTDCDITIESYDYGIYVTTDYLEPRHAVFDNVKLKVASANGHGIKTEKLTVSNSDIEINSMLSGIVFDSYQKALIENSKLAIICSSGNAIKSNNDNSGTIHIANSDITAKALGTDDDSGYGISAYAYGFYIDNSTKLYLCGELGATNAIYPSFSLDKFVGSDTLDSLSDSDELVLAGDTYCLKRYETAGERPMPKTVSGGSQPFDLDDRTINISSKALEILSRFVNSYQNELELGYRDAYVYFGKDANNNPLLYRGVGYTSADGTSYGLSVDGRGNGNLTLSSEYKYSTIVGFADTNSNVYKGSKLEAAMNAAADKLSASEKSAVVPRTLKQESYSDGSCDGIAGEQVNNAYLWPFSTSEIFAFSQNHFMRDAVQGDFVVLRSPGENDSSIAYLQYEQSSSYVQYQGDSAWGVAGTPITDYTFSVYPVFNLDLSKVVMVSKFDKTSGAVTDYTGDWKLTLSDDARSSFTAAFAGISGTTLSVDYTNAIANSGGSTNERIAFIITDSTGSKVTYYDSVQCDAASGTAQLTLPKSPLDSGDRVFVFSEQNNGDKNTDLASPFVEIDITYHTHSFTYSASSDTITASCANAEGCPLTGGEITLTVSATGGTYNGLAFTASTNDATTGFTSVTGTTPVIEYYKGDDKLAAAPVSVGAYTAKLTLMDKNSQLISNSGVTVEATTQFAIAKASQVITASETQNFTYGDTNRVVTAAVSTGDGILSYVVKSGDSVTVDSSTGSLTILKTGESVVTITASATENYNSASKDITVSIGKKELVKPTATSASFVYTGSEQTYNPVGFDSATMNISGNKQTDANPDGYTVTVTLKDTDNYKWSTEGSCTLNWIIQKADQSAPAITDVSDSSATVAEADRSKLLQYCVDDSAADASKQWLDVPDLNTDGTFELQGLTEGDHTLYLRVAEDANYKASPSTSKAFTLDHYSIEYNANGGTGAPASVVQNKPGTVTVAGINTLKRSGYTAIGWNTKPDGSGTPYTTGTELSDGIILYAQWTPNTYTVIFDANDGEGTMGSQDIVFDQKTALIPGAFTRSGYTFMGWSKRKNGPVQYSDEQEICNLASDGELTLYAVWAQNTYQLNVNVLSPTNGGISIEVRKGNSVFKEETLTLGSSGSAFAGTKEINGLMDGVYNVVVNQSLIEKGITESAIKLIDISGSDNSVDFNLTNGNVSAELEVKDGTPDVMVDGLNEEADGYEHSSIDVKVKMTIDKQEEGDLPLSATAEQRDTQKAIKEIKNLATKDVLDYMNITVEKTDIVDNVAKPAVRIDHTTNVMEIAVLFDPAEKYSIMLYRYHDNAATPFTRLSSRPTSFTDATFYIDEENGLIYIYAQKFSTYAIGYDTSADIPGYGSGSASAEYPINLNSTENGKAELSSNRSIPGKTITITANANSGYDVGNIIVKTRDGKTVSLKDLGAGKYSFVMPASEVTVNVMFAFVSSVHDCPRDETCPIEPFGDTKNDYWWHDGVHYCIENGLMIGVTKEDFKPYADTSRAMLATILWRLSGSPQTDYQYTFKDVPEGTWYAEAVRWAQKNKVFEGYSDEEFGPNDAITREQMMAVFCRYYKFRGNAANCEFDLSMFKDKDKVSKYAVDGVKWSVNNCVIQGDGDYLNPKANCTRAQAACIVQRYCEMFDLLQ